MTPPAPSVTALEIMPVFGQSENRPLESDYFDGLDAATAGQVYYVSGLSTDAGAEIGPAGAGTAAINQGVPANGFRSAAGYGLVSPAFTFQMARAARWRDAGDTARGVIIGDNGSGGRFLNEWAPDDPSPLGRNQNFWMRQAASRAAVLGLTVTAPYFYLFQGQSGGLWTYQEYMTAFDNADDFMADQAAASFGADPKPITVVIGGTVNTVDRPYENAKAQYDLTLDLGGILATWQRAYLIGDNYIHPRPREQVLIGETCEWAAAEVEAGNAWNITHSVVKSGAVVTVSFALRPGETLMNRAGMYADYGGDAATCPNFGFEADGGIASVVPNYAGNAVTVTLSNPAATWLRFAMQRQSVFARYQEIVDDDGETRRLNYSAHRTTLFGSHTRASRFVPGETLWRPLPGFRAAFAGDAVTYPDNW